MAIRAMGGTGRGFSDSDLGENWASLDGFAYLGDANCEPVNHFFSLSAPQS